FDLKDLVLEMNDVKEFIIQVLGYLVDPDAAQQTIEAESLDTQPEFFPFTADAVDLIANELMKEELQLPRDIISKLGAAVVQGWMRRANGGGHVLIDDQLAAEVLYSGAA